MDYGLSGKVVVITGAAAGIGLATAQAFVSEGQVSSRVILSPGDWRRSRARAPSPW